VSGLLHIWSDNIDVTPAPASAPVAARQPKARRVT
jgi:hypothetical protein